jgi:organic radical activating enzyme
MRFPFALSAKIAGHIIKHKLRRTPKFAMVLQLEPLHTCNLTCTGCGRIREYSTSIKDMVPLEKCLAVAVECDAPMVSICGGEPLIYPKIEELIAGLLQQGRVLYVCTNAMFMRKKMRDYLAADLFAGARAENQKAARPEVGFRQGRRNHPQIRRSRAQKSRHPPVEMDVLERPPGRTRIHA